MRQYEYSYGLFKVYLPHVWFANFTFSLLEVALQKQIIRAFLTIPWDIHLGT